MRPGINRVDAELWGPDEIRKRLPLIGQLLDSRYPPNGGVWQRRGGSARHDAVAWGFARAADRLGVDIVENCEVTGFVMRDGAGRDPRGSRRRRRRRPFVAADGHGGVRLPIHSYSLQAMVSEPVKPCVDIVLMHLGTGVYASQSDKGEIVFGGGLDRIPYYGQCRSPPAQEIVVSGLTEMFPAFGQLKLMRQWAGVVDVVSDSSPIIGPTPTPGIFLNCGWGAGGFKAIPAGGTLLAHVMATGAHHPVSRPFDLDRFASGRLIDEAAGSGIAHSCRDPNARSSLIAGTVGVRPPRGEETDASDRTLPPTRGSRSLGRGRVPCQQANIHGISLISAHSGKIRPEKTNDSRWFRENSLRGRTGRFFGRTEN